MADQLPFTPPDAQELISDPTSSLCGNFIKSLLKLPVYFWQLVSYFFDADGKFKNPGVVGEVRMFAVVAPAGWLECNGAAVSRTTYSDLFAAVTTLFGVGDGSTTFNVPDLRDKFVKGKNAEVIGATGGASEVELGLTNMPEHTHKMFTSTNQINVDTPVESDIYVAYAAASNEGAYVMGKEPSTAVPSLGKTGLTGEAEADIDPVATLPPYVSLYYYIYAGQS